MRRFSEFLKAAASVAALFAAVGLVLASFQGSLSMSDPLVRACVGAFLAWLLATALFPSRTAGRDEDAEGES